MAGDGYVRLSRSAILGIEMRNGPVMLQVGRGKARYKQARSLSKTAHQQMALKTAELSVQHLNKEIVQTGRPQRGTDYLAKAVMHEKNRPATSNGFQFGVRAWMNSSQARPYWRRLEYGERETGLTFVGRRLFGFFEGPGGRSEPSEGRFRQDVRLRRGRDALEATESRGMRIRHAIPKYGYLEAGGVAFLAGDHASKIYNNVFRNIDGYIPR